MNVFIALTPYHLCLALVTQIRQPGDHIILLDQTGSLGAYRELEAEMGEIFDGSFSYICTAARNTAQRLVTLNPILGWAWGGHLWAIANELSKLDIDRAYVFNDNAPESQLILSELATDEVSYIEDGAAPYNDHRVENGVFKRLVFRFALGRYYQFAPVLGATRRIKCGYYSFPESVRDENRAVDIRPLLLRDGAQSMMAEMLSVHPSANVIGGLAKDAEYSLYLLPRFLTSKSAMVEALDRMVQSDARAGRMSLVKRHPLDRTPAPLALGGNGDIVEIPSSLPAELLPCSGINITSVCAVPNTSLMAFRFLHPGIDTCMLIEASEPTGEFVRFLSTLGVRAC